MDNEWLETAQTLSGGIRELILDLINFWVTIQADRNQKWEIRSIHVAFIDVKSQENLTEM